MTTERRIVGYVRTFRESDIDCSTQKLLISRYSEYMQLEEPIFYTDVGYVRKRTRSDLERARILGVVNPETTKCFPEWEKMLIDAVNNEIEVIIVDRMERLYSNQNEKELLDSIVHQFRIQVFEADKLEWPEEAHTCKVAFYHYFVPNCRGEGIRTTNLVEDIGQFYESISLHKGWRICGLYIDDRVYRRTEFPLLVKRDDIDVVFCKYFYHINRKTLAFLQILQEMNRKGISLLSMQEGHIHYEPCGGELIEKSIIAVTYDCCRSEHESTIRELTNKRFDLFFKTIARLWKREKSYEEETKIPSDEFDKLAKCSKQFDVIVIDTFGKLGESVNELMDCINRVKRPIYSLQEGLLYLDGKEKNLQSSVIQQGIDSS